MSYNINIVKKASAPHKHKFYEIVIYTEDKGGSLYAGTKTFHVSRGNIAIIPPYCVHNTPTDNPPERIYINGEFNQVFNIPEPIIIYDNDKNEGLTLAQMIYNNRFENSEYVAALCNAFAHFLLRNIKVDNNMTLALKEVVYEITENFHNPNINLCHILIQSGYAEDYIRAQFKKQMGKTPTKFLTDVRIHHACYLIDVYGTKMTLSEIAERCGYDDYIYFSRKFKQVTGISPQKYKNS